MKMKNTIIVDLIKGFFGKTPKRLAMFRNTCIVLAAIISAVLFMQSKGLFHLPDWIGNLIGVNGIIGLIVSAGTAQLAKKDINEGK